MRRWLRRWRDETEGQALTEFAIVVPLFVMLILFAMWFYEVTQVKLKVQEAARFAAWEATAYKLHDYQRGPWASPILSTRAMGQISAETILRYADMDSSTIAYAPSRVVTAGWDEPMAFVVDTLEEPIPGGTWANIIFGVGTMLVDAVRTYFFRNPNYVAQTLIGGGKFSGWAGAARFWGSPSWGFYRRGYFRSDVSVMVENRWFSNTWVFSKLMPIAGVVLRERHALLADSWRLNDRAETYGGTKRPGYAPFSPFWQQVSRMYLVNKRTRTSLRGFITLLKASMRHAMEMSHALGLGDPEVDDFIRASVVSLPYYDLRSGKADIHEDMKVAWSKDVMRQQLSEYFPDRQNDPNLIPTDKPSAEDAPADIENFAADWFINKAAKGWLYDTAPMVGEYLRTYVQRGPYFMGCRRSRALGCVDSLSQDNPLGDFIVRGTDGDAADSATTE